MVEASNACFGIQSLGLCNYNPAAPSSLYFSLGEAVGALAFTLAVQQLLRPIFRFRLTARYLPPVFLYVLVFTAVLLTLIAAIVPSIPVLHGGPWGYAVVWEILAATLFMVAYGAVALAIALPVRVRASRIDDFTRGAAALLSAANEIDHVDFVADLQRSLPRLIKLAAFGESRSNTSAFYDFIYRTEQEQASYASALLRILADRPFCETLVKRAPWRVATILCDLADKQLYARDAEQFVREIASQAILRDDSMMAREVGFHGFRVAPLLSESLFSEPFILHRYDPFDSFSLATTENLTSEMMKRFNNAAERCYETLIAEKTFARPQPAYSIQRFYESAFARAQTIQRDPEGSYHLPYEMNNAVQIAIKMANKLLASMEPEEYENQFLNGTNEHRYDFLESLVEIACNALFGISNHFKGFGDSFWTTAIRTVMASFPFHNSEPDGFTPFQQRLALKLLEKLRENMTGYYPAASRVMLACIGPYSSPASGPNRTAFNLLKDAMYIELQRFPQLVIAKPEKFRDFLPDNVSYDVTANALTHTYLGGNQTVTSLSQIAPPPIVVTDLALRRQLTESERATALSRF